MFPFLKRTYHDCKRKIIFMSTCILFLISHQRHLVFNSLCWAIFQHSFLGHSAQQWDWVIFPNIGLYGISISLRENRALLQENGMQYNVLLCVKHCGKSEKKNQFYFLATLTIMKVLITFGTLYLINFEKMKWKLSLIFANFSLFYYSEWWKDRVVVPHSQYPEHHSELHNSNAFNGENCM